MGDNKGDDDAVFSPNEPTNYVRKILPYSQKNCPQNQTISFLPISEFWFEKLIRNLYMIKHHKKNLA